MERFFLNLRMEQVWQRADAHQASPRGASPPLGAGTEAGARSHAQPALRLQRVKLFPFAAIFSNKGEIVNPGPMRSPYALSLSTTVFSPTVSA